MKKNYEARHVFMAIAIGILLITPVFLLLGPMFVANTLYHTIKTWDVFVSGASYKVYGVGFLFLFLSPLIIFILDLKKSSFVIATICLILSGSSFFIASKEFTALTDDSISYRAIFTNEIHTYDWDEIVKVIYDEARPNTGFSRYNFFFDDGTNLTLVENSYVKVFQDVIRDKLHSLNLRIERRTLE